MIYLDYNATTPIDPTVAEAMRPYIEEHFGNPSSGHAAGQAARAALDTARSRVATLIGAAPSEIVFTSGGTESSNWAIRGVARNHWFPAGGVVESASAAKRGGHFVTTAVEHPATLNPMRSLEPLGFARTEVPVDGTGLVDPDNIRKAIRPDTVLISVMHAQNEVGTIEPLAQIGRIARQAGVLFHVDAAQSAGKIPVDVNAIQADLLSLAGHKLYAPKGIGALYVRSGTDLPPLVFGAHQESGRRAGTENVIMAVAFGKAAELALAHLDDNALSNTRDYFWERLSSTFGDRVVLNGHPTERLPSTLNVSFPGRVGGEILAGLDGVCASTGAACHAGDTRPSAVLTAMNVGQERAVGTIRFSVGRPTTRAEIDSVVGMMAKALR
ncbi:MAG: cysteine desulfurase family protein [Phycisphaerae bacterium]